MQPMSLVGVAGVCLMPILGQMQGLKPAEKKLVQSIESRLPEELAALEKVVNIDSGTFNTAGVREAGRYFQEQLEAIGFKTRWASMPEAMHRAGHLIAERVAPKGTGQRVLLIGHLDTIFEGQGHRFQRTGDKIRGAGIIDMKGGDIVVLYALKALHNAGMLEGATVRVFLTGDEENPGTPTDVSRRDLVEIARQSDVAFSFEPDTGKAVIGRRGLSTWSLDVTGAQGHSAAVLRLKGGAGAIYEASRILDEFQKTFAVPNNVTVNPGIFLGGTDVSYDAAHSSGTSAGKFNVVARTATVKGDLRFLTDAERDEAKRRMREIAAANLMKTSAQLNYEDLVPGWPPTDGSKAMFAILDAVSRDLDMGAIEVDDPASRGFGDFNFIGSYVSGVDGLGVKGDGAHSPNESMDPKFLGPATQRAAVLFSRVIQLRR
jgi:glutamate carboxypeptidase